MVSNKEKKAENGFIKDSREIALERAREIEGHIEKLPREEKKEEEGLEKLKEKALLADTYYDQLLRLRAEFDNYRKRINKEREEYQETAREEVIYELLGIVDNFERAIKSTEENRSFEKIFEGVKLIYKQLNEFLTSYGVDTIKAKGKKFDPAYHEAVGHDERDTHEEDIVTEEVLKGYIFRDKVLRPAAVKVSKKKTK